MWLRRSFKLTGRCEESGEESPGAARRARQEVGREGRRGDRGRLGATVLEAISLVPLLIPSPSRFSFSPSRRIYIDIKKASEKASLSRQREKSKTRKQTEPSTEPPPLPPERSPSRPDPPVLPHLPPTGSLKSVL